MSTVIEVEDTIFSLVIWVCASLYEFTAFSKIRRERGRHTYRERETPTVTLPFWRRWNRPNKYLIFNLTYFFPPFFPVGLMEKSNLVLFELIFWIVLLHCAGRWRRPHLSLSSWAPSQPSRWDPVPAPALNKLLKLLRLAAPSSPNTSKIIRKAHGPASSLYKFSYLKSLELLQWENKFLS